MKLKPILILLTLLLSILVSRTTILAQAKKPNILVIWGDDIGITNLSCYSDGLMGYRTPNIDRIAKEGCNFTDWYGQQSCTAGRAAFITGQSPIRTGLTKVGLPGADLGLQKEDPSVAHSYELLMYDAMIEVRAFKERVAAAQWLEVPLRTLECPS